MKIKLPLFMFFIYLALVSYSQNDSLNQVDTNGKKTGKWIEYIDKNWKKVKHKEKASFCRYTYYEKGQNLTLINRVIRISGNKRLTVNGERPINKTGDPQFLNGRYCWYKANGKLKKEMIWDKGDITLFKYYRRNPVNKNSPESYLEIIDFTKKFNKQRGTWYYEKYDKIGNVIKHGYFMKYEYTGEYSGKKKAFGVL